VDETGRIANAVCVSGRFQPLHADHLSLMRQATASCRHLVVAITNPDPGTRRLAPESSHRHTADANPFTFYERLELVTSALSSSEGLGEAWGGRVTVVPLDLGRPQHWSHYVPLETIQYVRVHGPWEREKARRLAEGGYRVIEVPGDPGRRRTSTAIREAMRSGPGWEDLVPAATVLPLRTMLAHRAAAGTSW